MSTLDVVIGAGVALLGTVVTETSRWFTAKSEQGEHRLTTSREYERQTLEVLQRVASVYRTSLSDYHAKLDASERTDPVAERALQVARQDYQAVVFRATPDVIDAMEAWAKAAVEWSSQEGSAEVEDARWSAAMRLCGNDARSTHDELRRKSRVRLRRDRVPHPPRM